MAISVNNYLEFEELVNRLWSQTPLFGFILYDRRISHRQVVTFLEKSAEWLDDLAVQCGIYILFPLKTKQGGFKNPSPLIAKEFGLQPNRLPGIVLFPTSDEEGFLKSKHYLFIPIEVTDFKDLENIEGTIADLFSMVQLVLSKGAVGHEALEKIKSELQLRRKRKVKDNIIRALRSGAHIVLKKFPEKFIMAFAEGLGNALGRNVAI